MLAPQALQPCFGAAALSWDGRAACRAYLEVILLDGIIVQALLEHTLTLVIPSIPGQLDIGVLQG